MCQDEGVHRVIVFQRREGSVSCVHEGRTGVGQKERRVEVSWCINFSFRGKMCLPREGTVCPGKANQESGFPPNIQPCSLCSLSPRNRTCTHTYTYTHRHYDHEGGEQTAVVYLLDSAEHVERLKVKSEYTQWPCLILLLTGDQSGSWHPLIYSNLCLCNVIVAEAGQEYCGIWPWRLEGNAKSLFWLVRTL